MGQAAAVVHPRPERWLRVPAKGDEVMQAIGMVCSEHASHRKRALLPVAANHGARRSDGCQRPATASQALANFGGNRSIVDLEDGGTAPTWALHHTGEQGEWRDWLALRGCEANGWHRQGLDGQGEWLEAIDCRWLRGWRNGSFGGAQPFDQCHVAFSLERAS